MLFTFPSRYLFTIGRRLVFSLTRWSAQIHTTFHVCCATQGHPRAWSDFDYGGFTLCAATFQKLHLSFQVPYRGPTTPRPMDGVWAIPFSLATTDGIDSLSFPLVTEMFHFTRSRELFPILFRKRRSRTNGIRLPHSEISGSKVVCTFPKLIAAYHVLHRLSTPRHPLCALISLIPIRNQHVRAFTAEAGPARKLP